MSRAPEENKKPSSLTVIEKQYSVGHEREGVSHGWSRKPAGQKRKSSAFNIRTSCRTRYMPT